MRAVARHRRLLAALSLSAAVAVGLPVLAPSPPAVDEVLVAARDLPAGHVLAGDDLVLARWPVDARPAGVLPAVEGRVTASAVRRGEPLTDARVLGPGLLDAAPGGTLAVTVRPADPAALVLLRPGDRAVVLAGATPAEPGATGGAEVLVADALVLSVPGTAAGPAAGAQEAAAGAGGTAVGGGSAGGLLAGVTGAGEGGGGLGAGVVVLAVDRHEAERLAAAAGARTLTVALQAAGATSVP